MNAADNDIFREILIPLVNFLSAAVGVVLVISLVVAGIQYMTSSGDPSGIKSARDRIVAVVWSFIIYIFSFAILQYLMPGGLL